MDIRKILAATDHTLLAPDAAPAQIRTLCEEALRFKTAAVCVAPAYVRLCAEILEKNIPVCTVAGFPNGYSTPETKAFEAANAVENGADEVDMVINLGAMKAGDLSLVRRDILAVREACMGKILKVIIEACLLTREEKIAACAVVAEAGADFIKTSTGFSKSGATPEDIELLRKYSPPHVKVKAAGGIRTLEDARRLMDLGADRIGASAMVKAALAAGYAPN